MTKTKSNPRPVGELDHAKIDPTYCLADGLFRPLRRLAQTPPLDIKYLHKKHYILHWQGKTALNVSDQSTLIALLRIASEEERSILIDAEKLSTTPDFSRFLVGLNKAHMAEHQSCALIETTCYELSKHLGLAKSGTNNRSIKASLERLAQTRSTILKTASNPEDSPYWASQILSCTNEDDKLNVAFNPMLTQALYKPPFTFINLQEQRQLSGEVAKRLHVWLSCWLGPSQERTLELNKLIPHVWGSNAVGNILRTRRNSLRQAITEIASLDGWTCNESATGNSLTVARPKL